MEKKILEQFLYNHKLKFNEIEKQIKIRSNKLAYHIKKLVDQGIIEKINDYYRLSETSEKIIPYLTKKQAILPVILVAIEKDKKVFLIKRQKRPFKDKLSLPGGRMLVGENSQIAAERILKEKFNILSKFKKINSISLEQVKRKGRLIHSFLLIFCTATTKKQIKYTNPKTNKSKIVSSDYKLLTQDLNKEIKITKIITKI
ncbi:MAG: NUDIX domain-containing protein [archaeon]